MFSLFRSDSCDCPLFGAQFSAAPCNTRNLGPSSKANRLRNGAAACLGLSRTLPLLDAGYSSGAENFLALSCLMHRSSWRDGAVAVRDYVHKSGNNHNDGDNQSDGLTAGIRKHEA
jgi:hypothetical protein